LKFKGSFRHPAQAAVSCLYHLAEILALYIRLEIDPRRTAQFSVRRLVKFADLLFFPVKLLPFLQIHPKCRICILVARPHRHMFPVKPRPARFFLFPVPDRLLDFFFRICFRICFHMFPERR